MSTIIMLIGAVLFFAMCAGLAAYMQKKPGSSDELRVGNEADTSIYEARRYLLSPAEYSFYKVLCQIIPADQIILIKARLGDLVQVRNGVSASKATAGRNRINQKHIDFVICDKVSCIVRYVIELDDRSHARSDRVSRDDFVDDVLDHAGIRMVRIPAQRGYALQDLRCQLEVESD